MDIAERYRTSFIVYHSCSVWMIMFRLSLSIGVSVLAVGVSNADTDELNKIAAPTSYKNIFYSPTFDDFPSIEREFINSICSEELRSEFKQHDEVIQIKAKLLSVSLFPFFPISLRYYGSIRHVKKTFVTRTLCSCKQYKTTPADFRWLNCNQIVSCKVNAPTVSVLL